jgi:hypothetical protein
MIRDETRFLEASVEGTVPPYQFRGSIKVQREQLLQIDWSPAMVLEVEMSRGPPLLRGSVEIYLTRDVLIHVFMFCYGGDIKSCFLDMF